MSGKKVKILLVEDNPADVRLIREMLSEEKETRFELESANLLSVALEKIAKPGSGNGLDLILLDLGLPDSIGFDTFLKTHAESSELPIIILTVMDDQELAVEAVRGGAQDYLVKGQMNSNLLTRSIRYAIERKRAEEDLRKSQNYFRSLIENSFDTIMILDQKAVIQYVSPPVQRILGYARGEGLSQSALVFIHPEDHKYVMEKFAECVQNPGMIAVINLRLRHKDGSWRLVEATGRSLFHDPAVKGFIINFRDITEHKQMEDALRVSEQRFQRAITAMEGGLWEWDLSTNQEFFSPRWCEIIGYSVDDPELPHTYNSWAERIHPDDSERVMSALKNHLEKGAKYDVDYRHRHKSGEYRWQNSKGLTIFDERGKPEKMVGCISDITVRKRAERAVADKNRVLTFINNYSNELLSQPPDQINDFVVRRLKDFTGAAAVLITSYDAKSSDLVVQASTLNEEHNSLIFRLLGKQIIGFRSHVDPAMYEEITTQVIGIRQSIHEVTFGAVPKPIGAAIQAALGISWFTGAALTKDKQLVGTLMIVGNAETSPLDQEFLSTFSSITGNALERKRTEEELRESEQRYATLFRNAAEGILVADIETKVFVYANPAICRMLGYSEEEIKRLGVQDIHPAESLAHVLGVFEAQALGKKPFSRGAPLPAEGRLRHLRRHRRQRHGPQ